MIEEENQKNEMKIFGLLGRNISYSFSSGYFSEKFIDLNLENHKYINFDIEEVTEFPGLISGNEQQIHGMNVTIPYKQEIIPFLDDIDEEAKKIGAVNTIKFLANGKIKGYNTDVYGFKESIKPLLKSHHTKALILGTGGASKAVAYALNALQVTSTFVSRNPRCADQISYKSIDASIVSEYSIIINCTPLGTFPQTKLHPEIPYQYINQQHLLFDLIYNPSVTTFLQKGKENGAVIKNGLEMLQLQAEKSWQIWNS